MSLPIDQRNPPEYAMLFRLFQGLRLWN